MHVKLFYIDEIKITNENKMKNSFAYLEMELFAQPCIRNNHIQNNKKWTKLINCYAVYVMCMLYSVLFILENYKMNQNLNEEYSSLSFKGSCFHV